MDQSLIKEHKLARKLGAHAFEIWGDDIARGEPFSVADATDDIFVFPYALGTRTFQAKPVIIDQPDQLERSM